MGEAQLIKRWSVLKQPVLTALECPLCHQNHALNEYNILKANDLFHAGELVRYQCPSCDVIFGDLRFLNLSQGEIDQDYKDLYSYYKEGDTSQYILSTVAALKLKPGKSYLDYACGKWNSHIPQLQAQGFNIRGYDRYVLDYPLEPDEKFDVVICNNYIEHVINPIEDVKLMVDRVAPGGVLILVSPCFDYVIDFTHYHTFFFVGRAIQQLEKQLGIKLVKTQHIKFEKDSTIAKVFTVGD